MKYHVLYDPNTGAIKQITTNPMTGQEFGGGGALLESDVFVDQLTSHIKNGVVVQMPPRPSEHHTFNYTTKQWQDPRTLQDHKAAQWSVIKAARQASEYAGFIWGNSTFDSDAISQSRIQGAVQLAGMGAGFAIDWTLANNTVRTLIGADMAAVGVALGQHVAAQHAKARALRAQIEAASTAAQVAAVVW